MKRIIIAEGQDSSGKSSFLDALKKDLKHNYLHATYSKDKNFNCLEHHNNIIDFALKEVKWQTVLIDRLSPSEYAYGKVFRNGESYDTVKFMKELFDNCLDNKIRIDLIYCNPSIDTFGTQGRVEMFETQDGLKEAYKEWLLRFKKHYSYIEFDWVKDKDYKGIYKNLEIEKDT